MEIYNYAYIDKAKSRTIVIPAELRVIGVEADHNSGRLMFHIPRYTEDGYDLMQTEIKKINYINAGAGAEGSYPIIDCAVSAIDDSYIDFSWQFSNHVTQCLGMVAFVLCFKNMADDAVTYEWHTEYNDELEVSRGLEAGESADEMHENMLQQWLDKMLEYDELLKAKADLPKGADGKLIPPAAGQALMFRADGTTYYGTLPGDSGGGTAAHGIVWNLTNVTSSNDTVSVSDGASLVAVLTPSEGYSVGDVTVTMGGEALPGAWDAGSSTVTIVSVTGDVVVSCSGVLCSGPVDTSPVIVQENAGYSSSKTINSAAGVCVTKIYEYEPNLEAVKASEYYDAENDWVTTTGAHGVVYVYTPSIKAREAGVSISVTKASKTVICRDGEIAAYFSNTSLTSDTEPLVQKLQFSRQNTDALYSNGIAFTLSMYDVDDSYAYWGTNPGTILPVGVRAGDIIFAGKNTEYYGMSNIDGTVQGGSSAGELSFENDFAMDYGTAAVSLLGEETRTDTQTVYGIDSSLASLIDEARTAWMTEYGGDCRKVPVIVSTDQHGRTNSGIFNMLGKVLNMHDVSKVMNLGDTISIWYDADTSKPLLTEDNLDAWLESIKAVPYSKRLDVFGNHDTWYGNYEDEGNAVGTRYPSSQAHLNQYFRNIYARRTNNNGWFAVYDDQFNIKYVVVSAFEYQGSAAFRIGTAQMTWLIDELSRNDGYDVVIVSHVPLSADPEQFIYPTGQTGTEAYRVSELDTDAFFSARRTKGSGTITDSDGTEHSYDFSACKNPLLCSLHGHTHYDAYLYLNNSLLVNAFDWFDKNTFFFVLIDRVIGQLNIWKVEGDALLVTNYQIPFDKAPETLPAE